MSESQRLKPTLLFVHGTGGRLAAVAPFLSELQRQINRFEIDCELVECIWGDPIGVEFEGKSLPDYTEGAALTEHDRLEEAEWSYLDADPLFGLRLLAIPGETANTKQALRAEPAWESALTDIRKYEPSPDLLALLHRGGIQSAWPAAWQELLGNPIVKAAFRASANNTAEPSQALAQAIIAKVIADAYAKGSIPVTRALRAKLVERLKFDWKVDVRGIGTLIANFVAGVATEKLRTHRHGWSTAASLRVGDILLYQQHGERVRDFLAQKIARCRPPVVLIAHSLGSIACVDLLSSPGAPPSVAKLITMGSPAPLFHEFGALASLRTGEDLPPHFPEWLNFYDQNDFLSYVGARLFSKVRDVEIRSGLPFPASHSGYFQADETWIEIKRFLES